MAVQNRKDGAKPKEPSLRQALRHLQSSTSVHVSRYQSIYHKRKYEPPRGIYDPNQYSSPSLRQAARPALPRVPLSTLLYGENGY